MASIEYISKRIEGKRAEVAKLEKKLARIIKAQESGWEVNPYYYHERDIVITNRDIEAAKKAIADYEAELETEKDKAASRNVPAITEFLDAWKDRMTRYIGKGIDAYYDESEKCCKMFQIDREKAIKMSDELRERVHGKYETRYAVNRFGRPITVEVKVEAGDLEPFAIYLNEPNRETAKEKLEKELANEYRRKYDFIIERTNAIVKVITDASGLRIGGTGELNGFIVGTAGTAKVQTIGAGGWNIQCYHFRTLIHKAG